MPRGIKSSTREPRSPIGVVILAGGEASRFPGKLQSDAGGIPLVLRVYKNVRSVGPAYVCANRSFPREIDLALDCPVVVDRWPGRGPLHALYNAFEFVREPRVFVTAADTPFVSDAVVAELDSHWETGVQAVVPLNQQGVLEPLCALYERLPFLEAARDLIGQGRGSVAALAERLQVKRVRLRDERAYAGINTAADRQALLKL